MTDELGHWCEFCQMFHSSVSCFHPGQKLWRQAEQDAKYWEEQVVGFRSVVKVQSATIESLGADVSRLTAQLEQARKEGEAMREVCKIGYTEMMRYGNIADWPPDMPIEYAKAINMLKSFMPNPPQP
jgi:hypothetical protein